MRSSFQNSFSRGAVQPNGWLHRPQRQTPGIVADKLRDLYERERLLLGLSLSSGLPWGHSGSAPPSARSKHSVLGIPFLGLNTVKLSRLAVSLLRSTQLRGSETRYTTVKVNVLSQQSVFLFLPVFVPRHCLKPCPNESSYSHTTSYSHLLDL